MNKEQKAFAAKLGIELRARHKALVEATGPDESQHAAIQLGMHFNTHIEAIIWILRDAGGIKQKPMEKRPVANPLVQAVKELPKMPDSLKIPEALQIPCQCPPLEPGIVGSKHMTSCPHYGR